jgi:hypothetical protein
MIKFFRRIRYNLLDNPQSSWSRTTRYLLYAIGEILLVVIGILIALKINNWNEYQKGRIFEREILTQIRANLIKDKLTLDNIYQNTSNAIIASDNILNPAESNPNPDSIQYWLGDILQFDRFQPLTNSYEALKSKGIDLISNKQLRFLMGTYYDDEINHLIKGLGDIELTFNNDWVPIMKDHIVSFRFKSSVVFDDMSMVQKDSKARRLIILNRDNFNAAKTRVERVRNHILKIQAIINEELNP